MGIKGSASASVRALRIAVIGAKRSIPPYGLKAVIYYRPQLASRWPHRTLVPVVLTSSWFRLYDALDYAVEPNIQMGRRFEE